MTSFLGRLLTIPTRPEDWGEALTSLPAIGYAAAFAETARFGPPNTTIYFMAHALGPAGAGAWAASVPALSLISIGTGRRTLRIISTVWCGGFWTLMGTFSVLGRAWLTPATATVAAAMLALVLSQFVLGRDSGDA